MLSQLKLLTPGYILDDQQLSTQLKLSTLGRFLAFQRLLYQPKLFTFEQVLSNQQPCTDFRLEATLFFSTLFDQTVSEKLKDNRYQTSLQIGKRISDRRQPSSERKQRNMERSTATETAGRRVGLGAAAVHQHSVDCDALHDQTTTAKATGTDKYWKMRGQPKVGSETTYQRVTASDLDNIIGCETPFGRTTAACPAKTVRSWMTCRRSTVPESN